MNKGSELRRLLCATAWAIEPEYFKSMLAQCELLAGGGSMADHAVAALKQQAEMQAARRQQISASTGGSVAVLPLYGVISQRSNWMSYFFGGTTLDAFTMQFRQALADPNISAIVIDVDSPGGGVFGVDELASEIYAARGKKTVVAVSDCLNASAAYYIASAASEIYASPSSQTGSIGIYTTHEDDSKLFEAVGVKFTLISAGKYKVEGNEYEPLTDEAAAAMQAKVNAYYRAFTKAVARGRGVKATDVVNGFGEGRMLIADDAVAAGLVDKVGTLDAVLAKFGVKRPTDGSGFMQSGAPNPTAENHAAPPAAAVPSPHEVPDPEAAATPEPEPAAAGRKPKADGEEEDDEDQNDMRKRGDSDSDSDSDDEQDTDDTGDDGDDEEDCACACAPCVEGDCAGCTAEECDAAGCQCKAAKDNNAKTKASAAEQERLVALERQQIEIRLALTR